MIRYEQLSRLDDHQALRVRALAADIEARDGAPPLSDDAALHLSDQSRVHFLAIADGPDQTVVGYAQLHEAVAEVLGSPATVDGLLAQLEARSIDLTVWSHGKLSPVAPTATARGYRSTRILWQLRRRNDTVETGMPDAGVTPVDGGGEGGGEQVLIRPFVVGQDEDAVLSVNAAAFAHHPEQGGWTRRDLDDRIGSDWFDPAGVLLATRAGELLGFHWTKIHPDGWGEVYVLAVSPRAQGLQIGRRLLAAGLQHLRQRHTTGVLLYVDDDNTRAVALYERSGFTKFNQDIQLERQSPTSTR